VQCEVCGRRIRGKPRKVIIEGAKMIVCGECARLGTVYVEAKPKPSAKKVVRPAKRKRLKPPSPMETSLELAKDYASLVRQAREKLGLSHEDLGRKIGEKVSVLKKIETGKMVPDNKLATKLEHALHIRLLVPPMQQEVKVEPPSFQRGVTLGEVAVVRDKKKEEVT